MENLEKQLQHLQKETDAVDVKIRQFLFWRKIKMISVCVIGSIVGTILAKVLFH